MKISFSTLGCPDWSWSEILDLGPKHGFDGVEVRLLQREPDLLSRPEFSASERTIRRSELRNAGFTVCGLASSVRFDEPEASQRSARLENGLRYIELARDLGARFVRVFGDVYPPGATAQQQRETREMIAENLNRLGEEAGQAGVSIVIETHGDFAASERMQALMSQVHSPHVGVLWDTHHPWRFFGEPLPETFERLRPWIRHTHWKDSVVCAPRQASSEGEQAKSQAHSLMSGHKPADYVLFGGGDFPILDAMRLLKNSGYQGWYSLEWEKMWHPEIEDPEVAFPLFPKKLRGFASLATPSG